LNALCVITSNFNELKKKKLSNPFTLLFCGFCIDKYMQVSLGVVDGKISLLFVKFSMMVFVDFDAHCYMFKIQVMKV
jgi:hypothetical protein